MSGSVLSIFLEVSMFSLFIFVASAVGVFCIMKYIYKLGYDTGAYDLSQEVYQAIIDDRIKREQENGWGQV